MKRFIRILAGLAVLMSLSAHAQSGADIPRLADGKPDFSGVWQSLTTANWNILTHGASAGPAQFGALLSTPPGRGIVEGNRIPYLPAATEQQQRNYQNRWTEDPELKCYMPGVPRANYMPYPFQIFHSDDHMLFAYQFAGAARIINLDDHQPSAIDSWMGISNASWDGDRHGLTERVITRVTRSKSPNAIASRVRMSSSTKQCSKTNVHFQSPGEYRLRSTGTLTLMLI
jgi:hypothetical protein